MNTLRTLVAAQTTLVIAFTLFVLALEEGSPRRRYTALVLGLGGGSTISVGILVLLAPDELAGPSRVALHVAIACVLMWVARARGYTIGNASSRPERHAQFWTCGMGALLLGSAFTHVTASLINAGLCVGLVLVLWARALRDSFASPRRAVWCVRLGYGAIAAGVALPICALLPGAADLAAIAALANACAVAGAACWFAAATGWRLRLDERDVTSEVGDGPADVADLAARTRVFLVRTGIVYAAAALVTADVLVVMAVARWLGWPAWLVVVGALVVAHAAAAEALVGRPRPSIA